MIPNNMGEVEHNPRKFLRDINEPWIPQLEAIGFKVPTLLQVLIAARGHLDAFGHTKNAFGHTIHGEALGDSYEDLNKADCFCTLGALYYRNGRYSNPNVNRARNLLALIINENSDTRVFIANWNDAEERTKEDVLELYSRAIARCQEPDFDPSILD